MKENESKSTSYCNCCAGITKLTPANIHNPPGLLSIKYRVGTYGQFKQSMHTRLGQVLNSLQTRENDDLTIGIVDACATILDILSFYQERIANEGFLHTAKEQRSIMELARSIGYELNPGVSASTFLAFTLEDTQNAADKTHIPEGTSVQTMPGQDELPQIFETDKTIEARLEWNKLKPKLTTTPDLNLERENRIIFLKGINLNLNPGDLLLLITTIQNDGENNTFQKYIEKISSVIEDAGSEQTQVNLVEDSNMPKEVQSEDTNIPLLKIMGQAMSQSEFMSEILTNNYKTKDFVKSINYFVKNPLKRFPLVSAVYPTTFQSINERYSENEIAGVYVFRVKSGIFGCNAPNWEDIPKAKFKVGRIEIDRMTYPPSIDNKSVEFTSVKKFNKDTIHLENLHSAILENSWIVLNSDESGATPYRVSSVTEKSVSGFSLSSKVTALTLEIEEKPLSNYTIRNTTVFAQSEKLKLADLPLSNNPCTKSVLLDSMVDNLKEGRHVAITGEPKDFPGTSKSSIHSISKIIHEGGYTKLEFKEVIPDYIPSTITINANVVSASHGETKYEKLGSGDQTTKNLEFILKQNPLTYVHSITAENGIQNTLEIQINDILWKNVSSLNFLDEKEEAYIVRIDENGKSHVIFGDGVNGKIPPTGLENISAKYRVGLGMDGIVKENKISLLKNRPLGVKSVSNPSASVGAEDPEKLEYARQNSTKRILTMQRIVSLKDVENYACAFPGVGKAKSVKFWNGEKQIIHLTVASSNGEPIDMSSTLYASLKESISRNKDPLIKVQIDSFRPKFFNVNTRITIEEKMDFDKVSEAVRESLVNKFSFTERDFGQPVTISEVISTVQGVYGVKAVDLDQMDYMEEGERKFIQLDSKGESKIPCLNAYVKNGSVIQTELLMINPYGIDVHNMTLNTENP